MKLEDFAHGVARKIFYELAHKHHFVVPEQIQEAVINTVKKDLDSVIDSSK
jgi:hypothetical protein